MTIDEAIKEEQTLYDIAKDKYEKLGIKNCVKRMEEHKQYIEWLEELKVYQQHEIICNKGYNAGYKKAIDEAKSVILQTLDNEILVDTLNLRLEQLKAGGVE